MRRRSDLRKSVDKVLPVVAGAIAFLIASISGCIALPLPPEDELPFDQESVPFAVGASTRDEVNNWLSNLEFSHQVFKFGGDSVWIVQSTTEGWGFFIAGVGYLGAELSHSRNVRSQFLIIKFDAGGRVSTRDVVTLHWGCKESGLCRAPYQGGADGEIMVLADSQADREAKLFAAPRSGCSAYVYSDKDYFSVNFPILVTVDDVRLGWLTREQAYYWHQLRPGSHTIKSINPDNEVTPSDSLTLHCNDSEVYFVRIRKNNRIRLETRKEGSENVIERHLALIEDPENPVGNRVQSER